MAANQAIEYTPQCSDLTVESLTFHNNNVVGIFSYPQTAPTYKDICKFLMNCLLDEVSTKTPLVVYQNFLREFWCTAIAYDPNPPENDSEARPLKEYLIKFSVMNGKKPLILDYNTFVESTKLDYTKGTYVSHPSPEAVKTELAKIIENPILLDRTPVLGGNYSSTKQINSIQQMIAYCLITRTKVSIGEIIYNDIVTKLTSKSRQKYVSYPRFISCALEVLLDSDYTQDETFGSSLTIMSNSNFSKDPSKVTKIELTTPMIAVNNQKDLVSPLPFSRKKQKVKSQTVTPTLPKLQGPKASGALSKKR
ncbi:hypothetical protein Tco_1030883 [Tanacetum coccineum]|uniref:Uncharacterized protein n=1 Tax=Tanacetum coccineum TaxID=301880 RepID=A0ABQ5G7H0_9ASTR